MPPCNENYENVKKIRTLINNAFDVNSRNEDGMTVLMHASRYWHKYSNIETV